MAVNWDKRPYNKEEFTQAWTTSTSIAEVIRKLNYTDTAGGIYRTITIAAEELGLTKEDMKGEKKQDKKIQGSTKNTSLIPLTEILVEKSSYKSNDLRMRLFKDGIFQKECSSCFKSEWDNKLIRLELDHINGIHNDNRIENLRILCPNCHALQSTHRGKNMSKYKNKPIKENILEQPLYEKDKQSDTNNNLPPIHWNRRKYTKEEFIEAWNTSVSIAEVKRKLGRSESGGGTQESFINTAKSLGLNRNHMTGQGHLKDKTHNYNTKPLEEILVKDKFYQSHYLRLRLLKDGIFEEKCSLCHLSEWQGVTIPLELDHINGNHKDNRIENLRIICPNCHSLQGTHRGKNKGKYDKN